MRIMAASIISFNPKCAAGREKSRERKVAMASASFNGKSCPRKCAITVNRTALYASHISIVKESAGTI